METLTRIVIFEKFKHKSPRFEFNKEDLGELKIFIQSLGGWEEVLLNMTGSRTPWFAVDASFYVGMANKVGEKLKTNPDFLK